MPILKIEPNKPLTLSLKYSSAQEKQGKYGKQFLYTVEPNDVIYLPPIAHDEIQKLHAGPGEPFTLTKTIGQGNQAVWKVERLQRKDTESHSEAHKRIYGNQQPSDPANVSIPSRPVDRKNGCSPKTTTNGKQVAVMPAAAPTLSTPQSRTLANQLIAAIAAVKMAGEYAKQQGVPFDPTSRDICALAITGGIQVFKEGVY
jgi:hypothetical protein